MKASESYNLKEKGEGRNRKTRKKSWIFAARVTIRLIQSPEFLSMSQKRRKN